MVNEIGSEFWKRNKKYIYENECLFLSGRTALDGIIKDAKEEARLESALLPSYCCHTMIEPFLRNDIRVRFYDVFVNKNGEICADIPMPKRYEIIYIMKYFGSAEIKLTGIVQKMDQWDISIEDTTHSCFHDTYRSIADYEYTSYRKWFAIDGLSLARKKKGTFVIESRCGKNEKYCRVRNHAFHEKYEYIHGKKIEKKSFLELFQYAEKLLEKNYVGCSPDLNSIIEFYEKKESFEKRKAIRKRNAEVLARELKDIDLIHPLIRQFDEGSCPLFYPVLLPESMRDSLRGYLTERKIYCPVHWPLSEYHLGITERARKLYKSELSLVCDQRYGTDDMEREAGEIRSFFEKNIC